MASRPDIMAGRAYVSLYVKRDPLTEGLKKVQSQLNGFSSSIMSMGAKIGGIGAAITGPIVAATKVFADAGDSLDKMSGRTAASVEWLSAMGFAAGQSGTSINAVEKGMRKMSQTLDSAVRGSTTSIEAFDRLGLSIDSLNAMTVEQRFEAIADSLNKIEDPGQRAALAMQVFGRSGAEMLPLLAAGSAGMADMREEAAKLGHVMSQEDSKAAADLTDAFGRLTAIIKGITMQVGAAFAPVMTQAAGVMRDMGVVVVDVVRRYRSAIVAIGSFGAVLAATGATIIAVGLSVKAMSIAVGSMLSVLSMASTAMSFFSAVAAIVDISVMTVAAVMAAATGSTTGYMVAFGLLSNLQTAYPVIGGIVVSTLAFIGGALAATTAATVTTAGSFGLLSVAMTAAAGVAASAWATITAPVTLFVAAGALAVGVMAAIGAKATYAALAGIRLGSAWSSITGAFVKVAAVVKQTGEMISMALTAGQYDLAARALWAGLQVAFWEGARGALKSFAYLFIEASKAAKRFFLSLLLTTMQAMEAVGKAITNPLTAGETIAAAVAKFFAKGVSFEINFDDQATAAMEQLKSLKEEIEQRQTGQQIGRGFDSIASREESGEISGEQAAKERKHLDDILAKRRQEIEEKRKLGEITDEQAAKQNKALDDAIKSETDRQNKIKMTQAMEVIDAKVKSGELTEDQAEVHRQAVRKMYGPKLVDPETIEAKVRMQREIEQVDERVQSGEITEDEGESEKEKIRKKFADELGGDDATKAFDREMDAIREQILLLEEGAEAARRFRLEKEGYDQSQIDKIIEEEKKLASAQKKRQDEELAEQDAREKLRRFEAEQEALEDKIVGLRDGQDAASRRRLEREGFDPKQIDEIIEKQKELRRLEEANRGKVENPDKGTGSRSAGLLAAGTSSARAAIEQGRGGIANGPNPVVAELRRQQAEKNRADREQRKMDVEMHRLLRGLGNWHG